MLLFLIFVFFALVAFAIAKTGENTIVFLLFLWGLVEVITWMRAGLGH